MKKFISLAIVLSAFGGLSNISSLFAQIDDDGIAYYKIVHYTVDTIFCKPNSNKITINVGAQLDFPNYGPYVYARARIWRISASGLYAGLPGTSYDIQEANVTWCFKGASQVKDGTTASIATQDVGTEQMVFKTGGKHKFVSAQVVTRKGTDYLTPNGNSNNNIRGDATHKVEWTKTSTENVTQKVKSVAWLNVPQYTISGLSAGAYHWKRPMGDVGTIDVVGYSFGLNASISKKAKYRFNYSVHENDVEILGIGQYKVTPLDSISKTGHKTGRTNTSIDVGLEFLWAPVVLIDTTGMNLAADDFGQMEDVKKHFGFRIRTEIRKGPISMRYDIGLRPGLKSRISGGEDNFLVNKILIGAYITVGVGFGIGLL